MIKTKTFNLLVFCVFFIVFYSSFFGFFKANFINFQEGSDNLVLGRLQLSSQKSINFQSGLSGQFGNYLEKNQMEIYLNSNIQPINSFEIYCSQIAFQGVVFSMIDIYSPFSKTKNLSFFYALMVFLSSLSLTYFVVWTRNEFNFFTAFITFILIVFSYPIIMFSKSLWWSLWSFYFPFVYLLFYFQNKNALLNVKAFFTVFALFFIKCIFSGYEFITTTVLMLLFPVVYYAIVNKWTIKKLVYGLTQVCIAIFSSIILSVLILIYKLEHLNINPINGVEYILDTFLRRSHDVSSKYSGIMRDSMNSSVFDVVKIYLNEGLYNLKTSFFDLSISVLEIIIFFVLIKNCVLKMKNPKLTALTITFWVSILAPFSWLFVFKSHAFIHIQINKIIWYMPFLLFGFAIVGYLMSLILSRKKFI